MQGEVGLRTTKLRENNFRVTQKYPQIHAINNDKAIGCVRNHVESNVKSLYGSEVSDHKSIIIILLIKQLEVERAGHVLQCPIAGDATPMIPRSIQSKPGVVPYGRTFGLHFSPSWLNWCIIVSFVCRRMEWTLVLNRQFETFCSAFGIRFSSPNGAKWRPLHDVFHCMYLGLNVCP